MALLVQGAASRLVNRLGATVGRGVALTRIAVFLLAAIALAIGVTLWNLRQDALADASLNTDNLAIVLAEQTNRFVQAVDIVMHDVQEKIAALGVATPDDFRRILQRKEMHEFLRSRLDRLPQVDNIALVGADGIRVNYSIGWPAPAVDMSDREYTHHFQSEDDRNLFVSEPVVSRATGLWSLYLVRRVNGPQGEFLGMVLGSVPLSALSAIFQSINLPRGKSFMLLRRDGTMIVRHPDHEGVVGNKLAVNSLWHRVVEQGGGVFQPLDTFDGTTRLVAVRPLRVYPLVMNVGLPLGRALAHWWREAMLIVLGTFCAACCTLLLLRALARQFQALEVQQVALTARNTELTHMAAALKASDRQLAATSRELETTLAAMDQGLVMVDAMGTVAVCNRRAIELLDLPGNLIASRPSLATVPMLQLLTGQAGSAESPCVHEQQLPNGRILEVQCTNYTCGSGWVATLQDITARRSAEQQIAFMARHDVLTLLPNRAVFRERIEAAIAQADRALPAALLCLDLDHFKKVNNSFGHPTGDLLLRSVAERLSDCVRQADTVARFGGDEFAVVQVGPERAEDVAILAARIIEALSLPYQIANHQLMIGVSIGIAMVPADGSDPDTLLKNADIAMYRAKAGGRGAFRFFEPEMDRRLQERQALEVELRNAFLNHEFELFYQPLMDLVSNQINGFEALMRWHHPTRGLLDARDFIALSEEVGLIAQLGQWALRQACRDAGAWPKDMRVAVNMSLAQFQCSDLADRVITILSETKLPANRLELEIAELTLLRHGEDIMGSLAQLRDLGVRISIDHFGASYLSLCHRHGTLIDKIKIDRTFVRDLLRENDAAAIIRAITTLGTSLGMVVLAEGVERPEQLARLRDEGCTEAQGFLLGVPKPADEIAALFNQCRQLEPQVA